MSEFKKRPRDGKADNNGGMNRKFAKVDQKQGNSSASSPTDSFLKYLVKARSFISSLDVKTCISEIPMVLSIIVDKATPLLRSVKDADQFIEAVTELRNFNTREKVSRFNIARLAILLDNCYYTLYYCMDVNARATSASSPVYTPKEYFTNKIVTPAITAQQNEVLMQYLDRSVSEQGRTQLVEVWGPLLPVNETSLGNTTVVNPSSKVRNLLLEVHFARWRESVCLLSILGAIPDTSETSKLLSSCRPQVLPKGETLTMKGTDPLLPVALRQWNDGCRIWPCHLYSFATPTIPALAKLASLAPLVEIGAGTGYWAHLLRIFTSTTESIIAYDKDPPCSLGRVVKGNDYHGKSRAWTAVRKGGPEAAALHSQSTLFLCYPPPDNAMGLLALRAYQGDCVCYVGEWQGDTGTKGFEKLLSAEFSCEELLRLPNWGDTCYSLTVWRRRKQTGGSGSSGDKGNKESKKRETGVMVNGSGGNNTSTASHTAVAEHLLPHKTHPFLCSHCGRGRTDAGTTNSSNINTSTNPSGNLSGTGGDVKQLFRCRLSYNVYFCSSQCAVQGRAAHLDELAVKCLLQGTEAAQVPEATESAVLSQPLLELSANYFVKVPAPVKL